jgi:hypothetical protein
LNTLGNDLSSLCAPVGSNSPGSPEMARHCWPSSAGSFRSPSAAHFRSSVSRFTLPRAAPPLWHNL